MEVQPEQTGLERKLSAQQLDVLLLRRDVLPLRPRLAARLLALAERGGPDAAAAAEAAAIVACEPALAARTLALAAAGDGQTPRSIREAVERLGLGRLRAAVLTAPVCGETETRGPNAALDREAFARHCVAVGVAARALAVERGDIDAEQAYLCGLLHDIGKSVLAEALPRSYARAVTLSAAGERELSACEREVIGVDHLLAGRRLAQRWALGRAVEQTAWLHHQDADGVPASAEAAALVHVVAVADCLARDRQVGVSGNAAAGGDVSALARRVGLLAGVVQRIAAELPELAARQEQAALPARAAPARYGEALARAAAELAADNERLEQQAAALAGRAEAAERFAAFAASLPAEAALPDVLAGIAAAYGAASEAVAYAVAAGGATALAVRRDERGRLDWRMLDLAALERSPAGLPLAALLAEPRQWEPWGEPDALAHEALIFADEWLGGVAYRPSPRPPAGELAAAMAMALAVVRRRARAEELGEELAAASRDQAGRAQALLAERALEAVGDLAAGAAHELNNPLAVVSGRAQLMRDRTKGKKQRETWQIIVEQAQRISDIISDLMEYARPRRPQPAALDVRELLESAAAAFSASGHPQAAAARVDIEIGQDAPAAWADGEQVRKALVELIANAAAAAPRVWLRAEADPAGLAVLLTVRDNGPGMDADVAARACTPFFSAQPAGRRRGMGLPKAKRYVESNGGRLRISSRPREGTTVSIQLPRAPRQRHETEAQRATR